MWVFILGLGAFALADCSREASREAVKLFETQVVPIVERHGFTISESCPLRAGSSKYAIHENLIDTSTEYPSCRSCKKKFRSQAFLDRHFASKHGDLERPMGSCPGDYCGLLRCKSKSERLKPEERHSQCLKVFSSCVDGNGDSEERGRVIAEAVDVVCHRPERTWFGVSWRMVVFWGIIGFLLLVLVGIAIWGMLDMGSEMKLFGSGGNGGRGAGAGRPRPLYTNNTPYESNRIREEVNTTRRRPKHVGDQHHVAIQIE